MSRESVYSALFGLVDGVTWGSPPVGFKTTSRRIVLFSDVEAAKQPWFGQAEHNETVTQQTNQPYRWVFSASWMVYHQVGKDRASTPAITNNLIIDALEKALEPKVQDPGFFDRRNTLSGVVHHCFIDGEVFKDPGDIDGQALIIVPIKILVP